MTVPTVPEAPAPWVASGMAELTGWPDRPGLGPPPGFDDALRRVVQVIATASGRVGTTVTLDPYRLLAERARYLGLSRRGRVSCGGASRLVAAADGWLAVTLARPDDEALVPAWLGLDGPLALPMLWEEIQARCASLPLGALVARAVPLGLPVGALPGSRAPATRPPVRALLPTAGPGPDRVSPTAPRLRVADLSGLWAGPLCGRILAQAGAEVVKIESAARPDGARRGSRPFFEALNGAKRSVVVDLRAPRGVARLVELVSSADVVIESSRPRALEQLGIVAADLVRRPGPPAVWVSITGYGRQGEAGRRVAFGDDAAVAGGLVAGEPGAPTFCGDAIADPLTGMVAAAAALEAVARGGSALLDVAMVAVAASFRVTATPDWASDGHPAEGRSARRGTTASAAHDDG